MPFLLYTLYRFNFFVVDDILSKTTATILLFISLILAQALVFDTKLSGQTGEMIVQSLSLFIGYVGLWIFVIIGFVVAFILLFEEKLDDIKQFLFSQTTKPKSKPTQNNFQFNKPYKPAKKIVEEENVVVKEMGDVAEISIEDIPQENKPIFNTQENVYQNNTQQEQEINQATNSKDIQINKQPIDTIQETKEDTKQSLAQDNDALLQANKNQAKKSSVIVDELEENKKLLEDIETGDVVKPKDFQLPPIDIFQKPKDTKLKVDEEFIDKKIADLLEKLRMFKIEGDVVRTYTGPIVTTFEFKPALNVKVSKILNLQDDLAMALKAQTIRLQAPIPGKDVVGIEVPNDKAQTIYLRELLESELFQNAISPLTMILGKDIVGKPFIADLKKLPHLLIAGTTGSGKSVGLNAMILSLLYKNSPDNLKLIMIDPKMIEFSIYNDIPHLLTPVIIKPTEAINALANMVVEMERRYVMMAETKTKNIDSYNEKVKAMGKETMPYIVIIIDELADLMMTSGKEVEISIARIAQKARACGIHLIVATQRPSVDVVTGLIKANLPSRISYKVGQRVDSKIILDSLGAESLL